MTSGFLSGFFFTIMKGDVGYKKIYRSLITESVYVYLFLFW